MTLKLLKRQALRLVDAIDEFLANPASIETDQKVTTEIDRMFQCLVWYYADYVRGSTHAVENFIELVAKALGFKKELGS